MLRDYGWYTVVTIVLVYWYLHIVEVLPKLRKYRKVYLRDWGIFGLNLTNLFEYKDICEKENQPLIWYKAQLYLIYAFVGMILISMILWLFN